MVDDRYSISSNIGRYTSTCEISSRSVYSVVLWRRKTPIFAVLWTSAFSDVASWLQSQKVEHRCTTTNLPLSNGIQTVSVLQRLHGEIGRTNSDVQKRDGQTDRQTNKKRFWPSRRQVKSEPNQTWHGDRGHRARSCTSKTFGGLTLGALKIWGLPDPVNLKHP